MADHAALTFLWPRFAAWLTPNLPRSSENSGWARSPTREVRDLLLEMMWQGGIAGCADIAAAAAQDAKLTSYQRVTATRALLACNLVEAVREVAKSVLSEPEKWPDRFVHVMAGDLFPGILSVDELITLVERTREPGRVTGGFSWTMSQIAEELEPHFEASYRLRDALADLIWRGRIPGQRWHSLRSRFDHVAPALALLCDRQLSAATPRRDVAICRSCVIANRFGHNHAGFRGLVRGLSKQFEADPALREMAFWSEVALLDELPPQATPSSYISVPSTRALPAT